MDDLTISIISCVIGIIFTIIIGIYAPEIRKKVDQKFPGTIQNILYSSKTIVSDNGKYFKYLITLLFSLNFMYFCFNRSKQPVQITPQDYYAIGFVSLSFIFSIAMILVLEGLFERGNKNL